MTTGCNYNEFKLHPEVISIKYYNSLKRQFIIRIEVDDYFNKDIVLILL